MDCAVWGSHVRFQLALGFARGKLAKFKEAFPHERFHNGFHLPLPQAGSCGTHDVANLQHSLTRGRCIYRTSDNPSCTIFGCQVATRKPTRAIQQLCVDTGGDIVLDFHAGGMHAHWLVFQRSPRSLTCMVALGPDFGNFQLACEFVMSV